MFVCVCVYVFVQVFAVSWYICAVVRLHVWNGAVQEGVRRCVIWEGKRSDVQLLIGLKYCVATCVSGSLSWNYLLLCTTLRWLLVSAMNKTCIIRTTFCDHTWLYWLDLHVTHTRISDPLSPNAALWLDRGVTEVRWSIEYMCSFRCMSGLCMPYIGKLDLWAKAMKWPFRRFQGLLEVTCLICFCSCHSFPVIGSELMNNNNWWYPNGRAFQPKVFRNCLQFPSCKQLTKRFVYIETSVHFVYHFISVYVCISPYRYLSSTISTYGQVTISVHCLHCLHHHTHVTFSIWKCNTFVGVPEHTSLTL